MECCFLVEAKAFSFLAKARRLELRLEERRKGFAGFILLGLQCSIWLVATVEDALMFPGKKDFVKSFREYVKVLMVRRGGNKACQLLEVVVYAEEGWKGVIWLSEGREGWGWRRFAGELRQMLEFFGAKDWPPVSEVFSGGEAVGWCPFVWSLLCGCAIIGVWWVEAAVRGSS